MKTRIILTIVLLNTALALAYVDDTSIYPPPADYETAKAPPPVGKKFRDPKFNSDTSRPDWIWRISDARNTRRVDGVQGMVSAIAQEYSTMSPFSKDRAWLLLVHTAYFGLYDGDGNFIRNLLFVCASCSPRWSRTDPDAFYYLRGLGVSTYNARTGVSKIVANALNYDRLYPAGEDDICFDGDHLVGFGRRGLNYYLYVFSISIGNVVSERLIGDGKAFSTIDSAEIAPGDNVIVDYTLTDRNAEGLSGYGIWAFDLNLNPLRQVSPAPGHYDVGKDPDGSPILVWVNAASYQPLANCENGIEKISINNPHNRQCLVSLPWTLAAHFSIADEAAHGGGWVFVSTYASGDPIYGGLSRKEEQSLSMTSTGSADWRVATNTTYSKGNAKWSDNSLSRMRFRFYGTKVHWIGLTGPSSGIAQVTLDDATTIVDLYSAETLPQAIVFSRENLLQDFHVLTIAVTGSKNKLSAGTKVTIDAIEDDTPWKTYTNEVLQVKLDGSEIRRLAHHRSRPFSTYNYQPRVVSSRDGKRLVFASNYGLRGEQYENYADAYLMALHDDAGPSRETQAESPPNHNLEIRQ